MHSGNRKRIYKEIAVKSTKILIFCLLACLAIMTGVTGGNFLFSMDFSTVQNIDVGVLKSTFNDTIPLIDTVYNNGNASTSILGEIENLIGGIFNFDLNKPETVLNAQSLLMYSYYNNDYKQYLAQNEKEPDLGKTQTDQPQNDATQLKTDASSITYDENEDDDKKDQSQSNLISHNKITILNETKYKIDIEKLLNEPLNINVSKKGPQILIYHTHTTESFVKSLNDLKSSTDNRTQDPRYSVVRVGEELAQILRKKYGFNVLHNGTIHDVPNFNSAYSKSLVTINNYMKSYPTIGMTFDIHRDASGGKEKLRAVTKVGSKNAAQIMFVVGTDQNGLPNPNWKEHLKFAVKLQAKLNEICPGLAKPIDLSANRYNTHVTNGSLLIEIGGDGNLLSECLESTKYVAQAINTVVNGK